MWLRLVAFVLTQAASERSASRETGATEVCQTYNPCLRLCPKLHPPRAGGRFSLTELHPSRAGGKV